MPTENLTPRPEPEPTPPASPRRPLPRWLAALRVVNVAVLVLAALSLCVALAQSQQDRPTAKPAEPQAARVPFDLLASNHMVVDAKINGKGPYHFIFDLGAPVTLLGNRAAEAAGVVDAKAPRSFLFSMRGEADVKELEMGDLKAKDLPVIVLDHPAVKLLGNALGRPLDGIIGYTFFARYKTTIDYQARIMTFAPVKFTVRNLMSDLPSRLAGPKVARHRVLAPAALWGLDVADAPEADRKAFSAPGVTVRSVAPGSPAEAAGLKAGDILTAIDGRWTTTVADAYAAAAVTPPDRPAPVAIQRDGKDLTLVVTPRAGL